MTKQETYKATQEQKDQSVEVDDLPVEPSEAEQVKAGGKGISKVVVDHESGNR